ncbi:SnoaL-like polyketide cyclase [Pseudomonas gingeri NCPPB 3146 = LMG 5327]|uniref:Ester cyclase n=2 Tax=Pseudomonas gingeri TaxID=117681 RepID=A0A7Y8CGP3_9PSED|nr:nuclear transport factor 2 family protein [Pseudomonas gingeri]NVZ62708.1 ester cyclase [Pseudomonas gingeri]NVZ75342.1 ester cyclase [Pseudomonas gingeri]NWC18133.1 ester cyclase [Pseudomonas gingeri]NWE45660.1 ester cyclase [Pseudomonas gingeri]NWE71104.1 ester cyclase [Pseudomonas gingeri]
MTGNKAVEIVESFWREVWQKQDPRAAARFVSEDFVITSGGVDVVGREAFIDWIGAFLAKIDDFDFASIETFQNADGTRVASRWILEGKNNGFIGNRACGTPFKMLGTAVWEVRPDGQLGHNWVERNALEVQRELLAS